MSALERGLTMQDIRKMQLGQVVDFCIAYNERQKQAEKRYEKMEKQGERRRATQADIDSFFG